MSDHYRTMIRLSIDHLRFLEQQLQQFDREIRSKINTSGLEQAFQLLQSIPGVQQDSAAALLAKIGPDVRSFPSAAAPRPMSFGKVDAPARRWRCRKLYSMFWFLSLFLLPSLLLASSKIGSPASSSLVERGRYLTIEIGKCGDCHTPHLASGAPDTGKWLKGGVLGVKPLAAVPGWASTAPDLTSTSNLWKTWGDEALVRLLVTGRGPDGKPAAPPMPAYTLKGEDARAIVAYLKSLK